MNRERSSPPRLEPEPQRAETQEKMDLEELSRFLKIPTSLQEAQPRVADPKRRALKEKLHSQRNKMFAGVLKELEGKTSHAVENNEAQTLTLLAGLMQMHSMDYPTVSKSPQRDPSLVMETRDPDDSLKLRRIRFIPKSEGGHQYELYSQRLTVASNRLPVMENGQKLDAWISSLFGDRFSVASRGSRPGEMSLQGGSPVELVEINVSGSLKGKSDALELFRAFAFAERVSHGMKNELDRRRERVLDNNWKNGRAYEISDGYLSDFVHEKAVEAFTHFFEGEGASFPRQIKDINMVLREHSVTPVFSYTQDVPFLNGTIPLTRVIELDSIPVEISELRMTSMELSPAKDYSGDPVVTRRVDLPSAFQPTFSIPYYPVTGEPMFGAQLKRELLEALKEVFARSGQKRSSAMRERKDLTDLKKYLDLLGIDMDELTGFSREEQEKFVKSTYRKLVFKYHPDRNPNDPEAQKKLIQLNAASEFLLKNFGLSLIE